ncbi:hypothetical protein [Sideroxydans sp. CL21]|uniref:hypothetical protein n=1 Tax=Sideroxydans sp. CL21 TaxID=2600596 RepID=UPI0024BD4233|nr:hypothetical protein [Sideroxydans sp. CL21]
MNPVQIFMITVLIGSIVMIVGVLSFWKSGPDSLRDYLIWGTGFLVAMGLQILALTKVLA